MAGCYVSADLCGFRASLLDDDGTPDYGEALGTAYTLSLTSLQVAVTQDAAETNTTRDACGEIVFVRSTPAQSTGATLTLTLPRYELETIGFLIGAELLTVNSEPGYAVGTDAAPAVETHFWTKAFQSGGSTRVPSPNEWYHFIYPSVVWTLGNRTLQEDITQITLTGTATTNGNIGTGGFGDVPAATVDAFEYVFTSDDVPDPDVAPYNQEGDVCGLIDTPDSA